MDSNNRRHTDPFAVNLTAGLVLRGEAMALRELVILIEESANKARVDVVFVKVSGSKLWIKEGDGP